MPSILQGPYGSYANDILTAEGISKADRDLILHPEAILHDQRRKNLELRIAENYAHSGADILTTNTFGSRHLLPEDLRVYREAFAEHARTILAVSTEHPIALSFGPFGDCYNPLTAPKTLSEGVDFWEEALSVLEKIGDIGKQFRYVLAETLKSEIDGAAFATAWKRVPENIRGRFQPVASLIADHHSGLHLRSGDLVSKAVRDLRAIASELVFGLNCCPLAVLEAALSSIIDLNGIPAHFIYPNASDKDPQELETSTENVVSRDADVVGTTLHTIVSRLEKRFPGQTIVINECCGGTPERTKKIREKVLQKAVIPVQ